MRKVSGQCCRSPLTIAALCSDPDVSSTHLMSTWSTELYNQARSWKISLTLAPRLASTRVKSASPPGRSLTAELMRSIRQSADRPRSMTRPRIVVSMLPPQRGTRTFLPLSRGRSSAAPGSSAARPAAPPPSTTAFCISTSRSIASESSRSVTWTTSSTQWRATSKAWGPTCGTARPSASVDATGAMTGRPALSAAVKEAHRSGSTPRTVMVGLRVLAARATPAMSPAPPTGTKMKSASGTCSSISMPSVPAPATISGSSYPLM
mmetsp:Transcript_18485/g.60505  ORF Transcript_18485/g.60505 Transcript_18485/m.60505 type:complete len:264 (+) Transcript_18485:553-1344(+)